MKIRRPYLGGCLGRYERNMANQMGKRYSCATCGAEVVVTKAGDGGLKCHDQPMAVK